MTDAFPTSAPSPVLPFDRAYWVLPGRLLAGYVPVKPDPAGTRPQLRALLGQGIRQFVSLMPAAPGAAPAVRPQALSPTARHRR